MKKVLYKESVVSMLVNRKSNNVKKLIVWSFVMIIMVAIAFGEGDKTPLQAVLGNEGVEPNTTEAFKGVEPNAPEAFAGGDQLSSVEEVAPPIQEKSSNVELVVEDEVDLLPGGDIQSLNFKKDMGIRDALRFLAIKYQKNIVPTPKVDGQLAFNSLYNVSFNEAMEAILGTSFRYEQSGNLIKVYTADEYTKVKTNKERMVHEVFTLSYISAAEALKLITPVLSGSGIVNASSESETGVPTGESISSDSGGGDTMAAKDIIVVYDYPENVKKVAEVLKNLDERPKQVLIEATILSAKLTEGMDFGIDFNMLKGVALTGGVSQVAGGVVGNPIETAGFATAGTSGLRVGISAGDIAGFLTALETVTDTTILANPKIMAVNKQLGQVYIGTKLGYKAQTSQTDGGSTTSEVKFLDTGTKLSFRPYIGDDGYIRMDIHPKDSSGSLNADKVP
ncbi:MAG TPA: secretin N-terminal domain-containing protein, partial [Sedimentisphaerales bacterium]|nr:secretin N-terminal domain-containing protein [Sedimentisphaerales bacterium]